MKITLMFASFAFYLVCTLLDGRLGPPGVLSTILEIILEIIVAYNLSNSKIVNVRKLVAIPTFFAIGDLFYGLCNYFFHWPFPNQTECLIYVIPYMIAMGLILKCLFSLIESAIEVDRRPVKILAVICCVAGAILVTTIITIPALHKTPTLSIMLGILTAIYSILEGLIIGLSVALLFFSGTYFLQIGLIGILVMHISDVAIRYQSVDLSSMGMSFFENGWSFGLLLISFSSLYIRSLNQQKFLDFSWDPLASIRGICVGSVSIVSIFLWILFCFYADSLHSPNILISALLLILCNFSLSTLFSNVVKKQILILNNLGSTSSSLFGRLVPSEIIALAHRYDLLEQKLTKEKYRVLTLASQVVHDIGTPLVALRTVVPLISNQIGDECGCKKSTEDSISILNLCTSSVQKIAKGILDDRKEILSQENFVVDIQNAVKTCEHAFPSRKINLNMNIFSEFSLPGIEAVTCNLIKNAIEASEDNLPIDICLSEEKNFIRLTVRDYGIGMDSQSLALLRNGKSFSTKSTGYGIGLSSMVLWCRDRNLNFEISSEIGCGTEVGIEIQMNGAIP